MNMKLEKFTKFLDNDTKNFTYISTIIEQKFSSEYNRINLQ